MSDTEAKPVKKPKLDSKATGGLPAGAKPLSHQVAGHQTSGEAQDKGFYECEDGTILKALHPEPDPRGPREVSFYEKVFNAKVKDPILLELRSLLPSFVGVLTTTEQDKTRKFLQLEDITSKFENPCVIDVKIGKITYDPEATAEKRAKETNKYPPLKKTGFQLRGFRVYNASKGEYKVFSKKDMHELDENTILTDGLQVFFSPGGNLRQDVVSACLDKLLLIQQWFDKQTQFAFYASSVLIVYDGAIPAARTRTGAHDAQNGSEAPDSEQPATNESKSNTSNDDASNDSVPVEVRMIDFAHVFPTQTVDENYAFGLGSLIKYLRRLVPDSE